MRDRASGFQRVSNFGFTAALVRIAFIFSLGLASENSFAKDLPVWAPHVELWGTQEVVAVSATHYTNPFADVRLQGKFWSGSRTVTVDGFYDGHGTWKLRMMPTATGTWMFTTSSNDERLNSISGHFIVDPASVRNHGPVHVAKQVHFSYADGKPYFLLGTTSYNWINRDQRLQHETLATLSRSGFNKLRFGLFPKWYKFNRVDPIAFPYQQTATGGFDLERFDPKFFQNAERRIRELNALNIQADVILFHPYDHWGFANMDEPHNEAYLRYVVARLAAYRNVWWTMANEYDLLPARNWDALTQLVHSSDPYEHPIGIHNFSTWYDHKKPWIDHVILQDGSSACARSAAIARNRYGKPVVVDEYGYEGNNGEGWGELTGAEEVSRHWDITMAGAYASEGETYMHPGGVLWWGAGGALDGESPVRLSFLKDVMSSLPFQDMTPAPELVVNGTALAKPGVVYLFRFVWNPKGFLAPRAQVRLAGADLFKVELIDPWQMKRYPLGYTIQGDQAFNLPMLAALLQITAVSHAESPPHLISELLNSFAGEPPSGSPPDPIFAKVLSTFGIPEPTEGLADATLFRTEPMHYAVDFQMAQLQQNPAANAVLEKYVPPMVLNSYLNVMPPAALPMLGPMVSADQILAMEKELEQIPVE